MIVVDVLRPRFVPWRGGVACRLLSDASLGELEDFASRLHLLRHWLKAPPAARVHHYVLSPFLRARALELGAVDVDMRGATAAIVRFKTANPTLYPGWRVLPR